MEDLEIMEMFLLEPRGEERRLHAELLTARNNAAARCMLGSRFLKRTPLLPRGRKKASRGNDWDRFRDPPGELRLLPLTLF